MKRKNILLSIIVILTILSAIMFTSCSSAVKDEDVFIKDYNNQNAESSVDMDSDYMEAISDPETYIGDDGVDADKKMIWSGYSRLEVENYEDTYTLIKQFLGETGYIQEERVQTNTYYVNGEPVKAKTGYLTLRISSERFVPLMDYFEQLGEVDDRNLSSNNVTDQYRDSEARIALLEDEKTRLQEFLDKETFPENVFQYHSRLTEIQYEIESLKGTLVKWDNLVSYSVVTLEVREKVEGMDQNEQDDTFWEKLSKSFKQGMDALQSVLIFILSSIPVLILLGLLAFAVVGIIKLIKRISRKKKK